MQRYSLAPGARPSTHATPGSCASRLSRDTTPRPYATRALRLSSFAQHFLSGTFPPCDFPVRFWRVGGSLHLRCIGKCIQNLRYRHGGVFLHLRKTLCLKLCLHYLARGCFFCVRGSFFIRNYLRATCTVHMGNLLHLMRTLSENLSPCNVHVIILSTIINL